jgi:ribose transport system permease protein
VDLTNNLTTQKDNFLKKITSLVVKWRNLTLLVLIMMMVLVISQITPYFLTLTNMRTLGLAVSFNAIAAIGMTILMIGGAIDLSIGSVYGIASILTGMLISNGFPILPAILLGLTIGGSIGLVNGLLVNKFLLSPFLATLGTMTLFRGLIWVVSGGHSVVGLPKTFTILGQTKILDVQMPVYIMLVLVIIFDFLLRRSTFFRQIFYIGNNRDSAIFSGIKAKRVIGIAFVLSGVIAAFAGILDGSRLGAIYIQAGIGLEFQVITAAVIGGASLNGGKGSILGSFLGSIVMVILTNVFNLIGVSIYWQNVIVGSILISVVAIDYLITPKSVK